MQLEPSGSTSALRERINTAALALLLMPAAAMADSTPSTQVDYTALFYGEQGRTQVYEPLVRATRLFGDGQSISAQLGVDVITGASPSGALPSGSVQTVTSASGRLITVGAGEIPMTKFHDNRFGLDGEWKRPLGKLLISTLGVHASRERDYQSLGINGKISADLMQRLATVSVGGGYSDDSVFPVGGTPEGLSDGTEVSNRKNPKRVSNFLFGVSRVLTRNWMISLDGSRTFENGYLTEPYKIISLVNPFNGEPLDATVTDKRPSTRNRSSALLSSVYHLTHDVEYASFRYYRDSWGIRSNTFDCKYRHDLGNDSYLEPHIRYYRQSAAEFFTFGLNGLLAFPDFATSDYRLGKLTTVTVGAAYAFHYGGTPALWTVRAEYIRQFGDGSPPVGITEQGDINLSPPINTVTAVVGYSFNF